ncbi:hypothetical protein TanjilG_01062 [Lupinus angustifolius]|uniref:NADH-ubiquinone oxidoreductase chain 4 n=1 Tax=Lupinus angustifolius TaxID=3871 RepID=A0A1J7HKX4_LUPAN|nr:hypothetical protein TanjilG_01062 [Lupinus angustifolius]
MLEHFCECYSDLSGPILCPVLGSIIPLFIPNSRIRPIRLIGLCASLITFLYSPVPRIQFDPSTAKSQFVESLRWLPYENINFYLGIDGLSFFFVILTTFLIPICILVGWSGMRSYGKEYITASLIREFLMIAVFRMLDPLLFYGLCLFARMDSSSSQCGGCGHTCANSGNGYKGEIERKLYPTRDGRKLAALHLSSQRALFWIWKTGVAFGSKGMVFRTADLQISLTTEFSERRQIFLWIASFAAFAVKVPMVPVHIWLPEAHVEAPTAGSVILAGIPSKLGTHGFLRFSIPMFPEATLCSTPFIYTPSAIAIIYTSLTTSRQIDLKKIIAYSSVAHMNLVTIGMFSRAAAVRSPIFSYGHTRQGQNMCAGRATHQPTSNGGENIACRNKSLIQGVSKTLPSVPKTKAP